MCMDYSAMLYSNYKCVTFKCLGMKQAFGFFVLNPILSDLSILCKLGLQNLEKNVTPSRNRTQASD